MAHRDLRIHACEAGGFMIYGPAEEVSAFQRNEPLRPLKACSFLTEATDFITEQMDAGTANKPEVTEPPSKKPLTPSDAGFGGAPF